MANKYYVATNTGKGFITHEDQEIAHISGHPANVWVTDEANSSWASRVDATEKTKVDAEDIINATLLDDSGSRQTIMSGSITGQDEEGNDIYTEVDTGVLVTYELP
jgi:photosystem II stability/assembly factor-like uncharacterized protein